MNEATRAQFEEDIKDAVNLWASEYARKATSKTWTEESGELRGEIELVTGGGSIFQIPIQIGEEGKDKGVAVIDIGDSGTLELDGTGIYSFLWLETLEKLEEIEAEIG